MTSWGLKPAALHWFYDDCKEAASEFILWLDRNRSEQRRFIFCWINIWTMHHLTGVIKVWWMALCAHRVIQYECVEIKWNSGATLLLTTSNCTLHNIHKQTRPSAAMIDRYRIEYDEHNNYVNMSSTMSRLMARLVHRNTQWFACSCTASTFWRNKSGTRLINRIRLFTHSLTHSLFRPPTTLN